MFHHHFPKLQTGTLLRVAFWHGLFSTYFVKFLWNTYLVEQLLMAVSVGLMFMQSSWISFTATNSNFVSCYAFGQKMIFMYINSWFCAQVLSLCSVCNTVKLASNCSQTKNQISVKNYSMQKLSVKFISTFMCTTSCRLFWMLLYLSLSTLYSFISNFSKYLAQINQHFWYSNNVFIATLRAFLQMPNYCFSALVKDTYSMSSLLLL